MVPCDGERTDSALAVAVCVGLVVHTETHSDRYRRRYASDWTRSINTKSLPLFFIAVTVGSVFQSMTYGPIAAYMGELFAPNVRYSAASLAYQLAAITVSGGTPFIMTALIAKTGTTTWVAVFVALMGLVTFFSAWVLKETNPKEVRDGS